MILSLRARGSASVKIIEAIGSNLGTTAALQRVQNPQRGRAHMIGFSSFSSHNSQV